MSTLLNWWARRTGRCFYQHTTGQRSWEIPLSGLSKGGQWYVHSEILEFLRHGTKDLVCPLPSTPLQEQGSVEDGDALEETAPKEVRVPPATQEGRVLMAQSDSYILPPPPHLRTHMHFHFHFFMCHVCPPPLIQFCASPLYIT